MVGTLRIGKLKRYDNHPRIDGFKNIIVCRVNKKWGKLSPMRLGPFKMVEEISPNALYTSGIHPGFEKVGDKQVCVWQNMENMWQFSKIYSVDVDADGNVTDKFYKRREQGMLDPKPHRRVFPKNSPVKTLSSYYNGRFYDYQQSRYWYCIYYTFLSRKVSEYHTIVGYLSMGVNILLLDYDAPDNSHNTPITREYLYSEYKQTNHPFGHAMVLAGDILGIRPWLDV